MRQNRSFFVKMEPPKKRGSAAARPGKRARKEKEASLNREASILHRYRLLIVRLVAASLIFSYVLIRMPDRLLALALLMAASLLAGFECLKAAFQALINRYFTAEALIVALVAILTFPIGFAEEGTALMILYPALKLLTSAVEENVRNNALKMLERRGEEYKAEILEKTEGKDALDLRITSLLENSVRSSLNAGMLIAVFYALILPLFFHYNMRITVHRAITMLLVCTPYTLVCAVPSIARVSMIFAASRGTVFERAADIELLDGTKTVLMEKSCFSEREEQHILDYMSPSLDDNTFFMLINHLAALSEQRFAQDILEENDSDIREDLISGFQEAPGGMEGSIGGTAVIFGTRSYLAGRKINAPEDPSDKGVCYHLYAGGRYGGYLVLSENTQDDIADILHDLRFNGVNRCVLICEESQEEIAKYSIKSEFDDVFAGISSENRLNTVNEVCRADTKKKIYFAPDEEAARSEADIEIRIGKAVGEADALTQQEEYSNVPSLLALSRRMREIAMENAVIAFGFKAVIIFFSLIGYCNLWMAIIADTAAAILTILNANRVTSKSLVRSFLDK